MSEHKSDQAWVLRSVIYQERHRIVTSLTREHGVISALARNSIHSRRFGGSLDLFTLSQWDFYRAPGRAESTLYSLVSADVQPPYQPWLGPIKGDWERVAALSYVNELLSKTLAPDEPVPVAFVLYGQAVIFLGQQVPTSPQLVFEGLNRFLFRYLKLQGSSPQWAHCLQCQKTLEEEAQSGDARTGLGFSPGQAGWICSACENEGGTGTTGARLDARLILFLLQEELPPQPSALFNEKAQAALFEALQETAVFHLPGLGRAPIKSLKFLRSSESHPPASPP